MKTELFMNCVHMNLFDGILKPVTRCTVQSEGESVVPGLDLVQTDWFFSNARPWNGGDTLDSRLETSAQFLFLWKMRHKRL